MQRCKRTWLNLGLNPTLVLAVIADLVLDPDWILVIESEKTIENEMGVLSFYTGSET